MVLLHQYIEKAGRCVREVRLEQAERGASRALIGRATEVRRFLSLLRKTMSSSSIVGTLRRGDSARGVRGVRGVRGARADKHRDLGRSSSDHSWTDM